ncbi:MAG: hypothetical protein AB7F09_24065 [Parvibaculaceae bacterium]
MRRALTIVAVMAMMLAAGEPAMAQTPNLQIQPRMQVQPKLQMPKLVPKIQAPNRPPNMPLIKPSQALIIAQRLVPNSKGIGVKLLPGGNYAVTLRRNNQLQRVIIDGDTGAPR